MITLAEDVEPQQGQTAPFQEPEVGRPQGCGEPGEMDLQRRRDPKNRAGVGGIDAAPQESVGEGLGLGGVPSAQLCDRRRRRSGKRRRVEGFEQHVKTMEPGRVAAMPVGRDGRNARRDRLSDGGFVGCATPRP